MIIIQGSSSADGANMDDDTTGQSTPTRMRRGESSSTRKLGANSSSTGTPLTQEWAKSYFGPSPWPTNVDRMEGLKLKYENPSVLGKDVHGHVWKLFDCSTEKLPRWIHDMHSLQNTMKIAGVDPNIDGTSKHGWKSSYQKTVDTSHRRMDGIDPVTGALKKPIADKQSPKRLAEKLGFRRFLAVNRISFRAAESVFGPDEDRWPSLEEIEKKWPEGKLRALFEEESDQKNQERTNEEANIPDVNEISLHREALLNALTKRRERLSRAGARSLTGGSDDGSLMQFANVLFESAMNLGNMLSERGMHYLLGMHDMSKILEIRVNLNNKTEEEDDEEETEGDKVLKKILGRLEKKRERERALIIEEGDDLVRWLLLCCPIESVDIAYFELNR